LTLTTQEQETGSRNNLKKESKKNKLFQNEPILLSLYSTLHFCANAIVVFGKSYGSTQSSICPNSAIKLLGMIEALSQLFGVSSDEKQNCYTETTMASIQGLINKRINILLLASYILRDYL
jgi:hypothetical protein